MNIAIWGMGISGLSALKYLSTTEHKLFAINSGPVDSWNRSKEILSLISKDRCFDESDLPVDISLDQIILAPGIDRKKDVIKKFIDAGVEVICEVELAFRHNKTPIIAITGTNGKTTTATMMEMALTSAGKKVFLGGNIGVPFCDILLDRNNYDYVVLELSSFQLESLVTFRANVAIILNITESHMERYEQFSDYANAKLEIVMNQTVDDLFICPGKYLGTETKATKSCVSPLKELDFSNSKLIGEHHKENIFCIKKALDHFNISDSQQILQKLINDFGGVKFRLEFAGKHNEITFINDGKSTNIDATISAIKSIKDENLYLILGGKLRSDDVTFVDQLLDFKIKELLCFGDSADLIFDRLKLKCDVKHFKKLDDVFEYVKKDISVGTILFSPAFPSFDLYANYIQRGEHFRDLVNSLCD